MLRLCWHRADITLKAQKSNNITASREGVLPYIWTRGISTFDHSHDSLFLKKWNWSKKQKTPPKTNELHAFPLFLSSGALSRVRGWKHVTRCDRVIRMTNELCPPLFLCLRSGPDLVSVKVKLHSLKSILYCWAPFSNYGLILYFHKSPVSTTTTSK